MEANDKMQDKISNIPITEVTSSIMLFSVLLVKCKDVRTMRQKPNKLAEVPRIWWDVLVGNGSLFGGKLINWNYGCSH
jgi:hypothetical protein